MEIKGTHNFTAAPQAIWDALHDVDILGKCIPGAQQVSWIDPTVLSVRAGVELGPIKGTGELRLHVADEVRPSHIVLNVVATGSRLSAQGPLTLDLAPSGSGTVLSYAGTPTLGGLAAALDNPLTRPVADRGIAQFFSRLAQYV